MITERNRDGIHQFVHGFASTMRIPAFIWTIRLFFLFRFLRAAESHPTSRDSGAFFNDGRIDAFNYGRSRKHRHGQFRACALSWKSIRKLLFSLFLSRTWRDRFCLTRVTLEQHRRRKEKYLRGASMTASPLSLVFHRAGRGGFQDQDIVCPRSPFFTGSLLRLTPAALSITVYCRVAVLVWIILVVHIFIAK